ncbi:KxYKxGKxW signal peptide domain-containing protein, partial [Enterococcus sp. 5B3_DIV0040]|uniref:KxYKxGKxW signal peptide domain-containing protein n=1 Tax=Enterococcus sp. 5B3_DIV0040 TaxID=1834182 RepID=UPI001593E34C
MEVKSGLKCIKYKKGKKWVIAPILFIGAASFLVNNEIVKASEQPVTNPTVTESFDGNSSVLDNGGSSEVITDETVNIT